ncbi:galactoside alpha-(1,2)-fucosyltransferase 2-like [Sphaerodactylus townsendi]|uniref:galactoside alpha-(1,2)-fucosyltransferase 2-like n=1 Tax=Sphaerodactylus townsendi TaxID=933632 RepID=UPI00202757F1|nr:galactoside alpha-(1,2)-fucosyltransferase 2-like [Sphaerodactylus townsendi]
MRVHPRIPGTECSLFWRGKGGPGNGPPKRGSLSEWQEESDAFQRDPRSQFVAKTARVLSSKAFISRVSLGSDELQKRKGLWGTPICVQNTSAFLQHEHTSFTNTTLSLTTKNLDRGMWTVNSIGRLGNQMGEYATLYALAKLNGHQAFILPGMHHYLASIFQITLPVIHSEMEGKIPWRNYYLNDWMSEEYRHIEGKYVKLTGYPCSYTFYHHIRQEILQEFTFHDYLKKDANTKLLQMRGQRETVTYVGIHVRRGDYVHKMPNIWKGVVADKGYLEKAMDYFREKYHDAVFVVVSNGMAWCKENIDASRGDVYFSDDGQESSPGWDFALIAHCNHTIMTIGTFGIWAGYLAGGETVYLANYTLPDSPFLKVFKPSAAFLPEWTGIPADLSPLLPKS